VQVNIKSTDVFYPSGKVFSSPASYAAVFTAGGWALVIVGALVAALANIFCDTNWAVAAAPIEWYFFSEAIVF